MPQGLRKTKLMCLQFLVQRIIFRVTKNISRERNEAHMRHTSQEGNIKRGWFKYVEATAKGIFKPTGFHFFSWLHRPRSYVWNSSLLSFSFSSTWARGQDIPRQSGHSLWRSRTQRTNHHSILCLRPKSLAARGGPVEMEVITTDRKK